MVSKEALRNLSTFIETEEANIALALTFFLVLACVSQTYKLVPGYYFRDEEGIPSMRPACSLRIGNHAFSKKINTQMTIK